MLRKLTLVSCVLLVGEMTHAGARTATEMPGATARDCAPPGNFSKRLPKLSEKKALRKVTRRINYESPNVLKTNNPVTGAEVNSNNLYAKILMGVARYGRDHTFAAIVEPLGGERRYEIRISDTDYTTGSQPVFFNEVAELHVPYHGATVVVPRTVSWTEGFCTMVNVNGPPPDCFNTATGSFTIERDLFEALAASDPVKPIAITARKSDGMMAACPYYFSPLSFKATLLTIDEARAAALKKSVRR